MTLPHFHCPHGCEHPQPFRAVSVDDGWDDNPIERLYCGRCYHKGGYEHPFLGRVALLTEMVLCTPVTCPDDAAMEAHNG